MKLYTLEYWPVHVICAGMIAAAVIDWWKFKVPNKLTFPLIFSGWALGLANNFGLGACEFSDDVARRHRLGPGRHPGRASA